VRRDLCIALPVAGVLATSAAVAARPKGLGPPASGAKLRALTALEQAKRKLYNIPGRIAIERAKRLLKGAGVEITPPVRLAGPADRKVDAGKLRQLRERTANEPPAVRRVRQVALRMQLDYQRLAPHAVAQTNGIRIDASRRQLDPEEMAVSLGHEQKHVDQIAIAGDARLRLAKGNLSPERQGQLERMVARNESNVHREGGAHFEEARIRGITGQGLNGGHLGHPSYKSPGYSPVRLSVEVMRGYLEGARQALVRSRTYRRARPDQRLAMDERIAAYLSGYESALKQQEREYLKEPIEPFDYSRRPPPTPWFREVIGHFANKRRLRQEVAPIKRRQRQETIATTDDAFAAGQSDAVWNVSPLGRQGHLLKGQ
jgi:hypothetical protein